MEKLVKLTGSELKKFIEIEVDAEWKERDFCRHIRNFLKSDLKKTLMVAGLRSTGKTTGILQSIKGLENDTLYLSPSSLNEVDADTVKDAIEENSLLKNIVIDEYTWIKDYDINLSNYLAGLPLLGKKIIITGTESMCLLGELSKDFIHRAIPIHTTYFSYEEFLRLNNKEDSPENMSEYIKRGGVFGEEVIQDYGSMSNYISNAIIRNITRYFPQFDENMVKSCVYTLFYECICNLNKTNEVKVYKDGNNPLAYEEFLDKFGIDYSIVLDTTVLKAIASELEKSEIIIRIPNLRRSDEKRAYITNQSLSYQLTKCIYDLDEVASGHIGALFEASIMCFAYINRNTFYDIYYFETRKAGRDIELDLVLKSQDKRTAYIYECKHSESSTSVGERSSIVQDSIPKMLGDTDILGRYIIYRGVDTYRKVNNYDLFFTRNLDVIITPSKFDERIDLAQKQSKNKSFGTMFS